MHQARVNTWGEAPVYTEAADLTKPGPDEVRIKVIASGIHNVVRSRAAGKHYTSGTLPHVPGVDGVGTTEDGQMVYFASFAVGSLAQYVNMPKSAVKPVAEGSDPVQVAGIMNPALSSWMALKTRAQDLPPNFTVLILGATSASGRVAINLARTLGAGKVIGAARNKAALDSLPLESSIVIDDDAKKTDFSSLGDLDVVLDYVYGPLTEHLFASLKSKTHVQYVHIGSLGALDINLPGTILRSHNLTIRGSGPGAWSMKDVGQTMGQLLAAVKDVPEQPVKKVKLEDIEHVWSERGERLVVEM